MVGSVQQPFLYESDRASSRSPQKPFDPKAVTRASWEPKPVKVKQDGPLLQFNQHPDSHEIIGGRRKAYRTLSQRAKTAIKAMRGVQLFFRVLQLVAATGILVLMILINHTAAVTAWVMCITAGIVMLHCAYGILHLAKPAGARTPASSAAYQLFSALSDLCVLPLYAYGALAARNSSGSWSTLVANADVVYPYLKSAFYYALIAAGFTHVFTLAVACWLSLKFRQITMLPPDMNPLEDHLTSRAGLKQQQMHQRNKSSVVTMGTIAPLDLDPDQDRNRPPKVPFLHMHARAQSDGSTLHTRDSRDSHDLRDSRVDLPSRQYQVPTTGSARNSMISLKRASQASLPRSVARGSYAEIPLHDGYAEGGHTSRPTSGRPGSRPGSRPVSGLGISNGSSTTLTNGRSSGGGRFTENWYASDSLKDRTAQHNQALSMLVLNATGQRSNYDPVSQAFDYESDGDHDKDDRDDENARYDQYDYNNSKEQNSPGHPNPLRSNPMPPSPPRAKTSYRPTRPLSAAPTVASMTSSVSSTSHQSGNRGAATRGSILGELHLNDRRVSGGGHHKSSSQPTGDIADAGDVSASPFQYKEGSRPLTGKMGITTTVEAMPQKKKNANNRTPSKRWTWTARLSSSPKTGSGQQQPQQQQQPSSSPPKNGSKPRPRDSSIQADTAFYSKPYGELKSATPPILVGQDLEDGHGGSGGRQVSSGNDYDLGSARRQISTGDRYLYFGGGGGMNTLGRRNVSGKVAEEGRAYSRYTMLNE